MVKQGAACLGCSYDLGGLNNSGACPECGKPIIESLRGNYLQYADPEWFETLIRGSRMTARGFWIAIAALICVALLMIISLMYSVALTLSPKGFYELALAILTGVAVVTIPLASIWSCVGWLILTAREPGLVLRRKELPRIISRCSAVAWLALPAIIVFDMTLLNLYLMMYIFRSIFVVFVLYLIISNCFFTSSMIYIRDLACRIPDSGLSKRTHRLRWELVIMNTIGMLFCGIGHLFSLAYLYATVLELQSKLKKCKPNILADLAPTA